MLSYIVTDKKNVSVVTAVPAVAIGATGMVIWLLGLKTIGLDTPGLVLFPT